MALDILLFITWKTWHNQQLICEKTADDLVKMLPGLALMENVRVLELVVIPDHVHAVVRTTVQPDLPALVQRLKGTSSRLINRDAVPPLKLRWAPGYDARSMGRRDLPAVQRYFDRQAAKHGFTWQRRYSIDACDS